MLHGCRTYWCFEEYNAFSTYTLGEGISSIESHLWPLESLINAKPACVLCRHEKGHSNLRYRENIHYNSMENHSIKNDKWGFTICCYVVRGVW